MRVFDRLHHWLSRPMEPADSAEPSYLDPLSLGSLAQEIEDCNWAALQEDIDRFSRSFNKGKGSPAG